MKVTSDIGELTATKMRMESGEQLVVEGQYQVRRNWRR